MIDGGQERKTTNVPTKQDHDEPFSFLYFISTKTKNNTNKKIIFYKDLESEIGTNSTKSDTDPHIHTSSSAPNHHEISNNVRSLHVSNNHLPNRAWCLVLTPDQSRVALIIKLMFFRLSALALFSERSEY